MIDKHLFYILPFIIGVIVGIILLFLYKDQAIEVIDYPKPNDNRIFTDLNGMKFTYTSKEVDCDKNEATLKYYPLQS